MTRNFQIRSWMGIMGFMGFLGFLYFSSGNPTMLVFFGFFSFFAFYWWGKLGQEQADERLVENQRRASSLTYRISFTIIFLGMVLIGNAYGSRNPELAYALLNTLISLGFASSQILGAYLTYRYDQQD